ncbi:MAG: response regulatory protein [Paenibacillaceae bacterium]|nr:response regulatory protein [Paenibacillaceae bacterium]
MIHAILADDEPIIIKGLKKLIPWEQVGIRIVGEAWTGKGLLGLIEKEKPELVITDISMPDGSGIDVLKEVERQGLKTKVIFISAYQEFSYAKDAIAFGAVEYLVKPVEKELLLAAVQKAVALLQEESAERSYKSKLAVYEHKDKNTQLEELFDRLTEGDIRPEEAERKLLELEPGYKDACYSAFIMFPYQPEEDARWGEHEKRLLLFAIANMADESIRQHAAGLIVRKADKLCGVINHPPELDVLQAAGEIIGNAQTYLKIRLVVGVGKPAASLGGIKMSYASASEALERFFFAEGSKPIPWTEGKRETAVTERELNEKRHELLQAMLARDQGRLEELSRQLFAQIADFASGSRDEALAACYASLSEWLEGLHEMGVDLQEAGMELQEMNAAMRGFRRYEEVQQYVSRKLQQMLRLVEKLGVGKEVQQLQKVKAYIEASYMENLTLENVAALIFMNPYYFSSFFKKHTNLNFKQYLTEIRMKHALKLLLHTDMMVYEIAEQVGYNNARQFSDMFKKQFGKLPQEYRSSKQ